MTSETTPRQTTKMLAAAFAVRFCSGILIQRRWLLQVVELPREGPEAALKLFGGLPNLRVLVIGGDGTVAWILSCIDSIQVVPCRCIPCLHFMHKPFSCKSLHMRPNTAALFLPPC